jgi:cyclic pyranopterin phosphate synthase
MHRYMALPAVVAPGLVDAFGRVLDSLRVSVTDRCNLRCSYCMPEEHYVWLPRPSILDYEEIARVVALFARLGVARVRVTGGEPLLRQNVPRLFALLAANTQLQDLAMTTNGVLLSRYAQALRDAGLRRITVSLDTLRPERFRTMARRARLEEVLEGISAAGAAGFSGTKLNAVVVRGVNDDELPSLIAFGQREGLEVRFIEYMDVGGATRWATTHVVPRAEMLERLGRHFGGVEPLGDPTDRAVPADRFVLGDGTVFGIVASTSAPFCGSCGRSRLTADGFWFTCLYGEAGVDLKALLRGDASDTQILDVMRERWSGRSDRGAEERLVQLERGPLYGADGLRQHPHREMHTRGG